MLKIKGLSSLSSQIILSIVILLVIPLFVIGTYLYSSTLTELRSISKERAINVAYSANSLIEKMGVNLLSITKTNSNWEDNRLAVIDRNTVWIEEYVNVAADVLPDLDFVITADLEGNIISQRGDLEEFSSTITHEGIISRSAEEDNFSGLLVTSKGLAIIAVSKVTDDLGEAEPAGVLIFGRILDELALLDIKGTLKTDIGLLTDQQFFLSTTNNMKEENLLPPLKLRNNFEGDHYFEIFKVGSTDYTRVITPIHDIAGKSIGIIQVETPAKSISQFSKSLKEMSLYAGLIILVLVAVVSFFLQRQQTQLYKVSLIDELTGLQNRRGLLHAGKSLFNKQQQIDSGYLLFIDLDRFKFINDTLGHDIGDLLLQDAATRIQACASKDETVYRIGGDEFIVFSFQGNKEVAEGAARRIIQVFSKPFLLMDKELYVTASVGISLAPQDGVSTEVLARNADIALYQAKKQRNRYQFYSILMNESASERVELESLLYKALERDELVLYYQPKVDIKTKEITGVEALIRWKQPLLGMVAPDKFITLAEETGLIVPIGEWVFRQACKQMVEWRSHGIPLQKMAINLSAVQFQHEELIQMITGIIKETKIDPTWIDLEITESMLMQNETNVDETLQALKSLGISISIDDFGTGYSSLSYLAKFPIDSLKIDRSFIKDVSTDDISRSITIAILTLGKSLHLNIVAEGVEDLEQLQFLEDYECDEAQGYLFSKPITAEEFVVPFEGYREASAAKE
ncbi:EAL domain-containing protein [Bacillus pinisoli]|uniref:bifunctional diguanylate cyclase/phosphodiesterase n=1 Tax=Bacillus pinisoli TaxID=2901866 RepID=UPI001FF329BE|nr:EAL domain-containing protein [Bacillus pinisoli]